MPTPQAYYKLDEEYRDLQRAAFNLCMSMPVGSETPQYLDLWDLCGDYEPTEEEQGLIPIPKGYAEQ